MLCEGCFSMFFINRWCWRGKMNQIWFGLIWINPKDLTRGKAKKKCFGAYMDLALFRGVWKTFFVRFAVFCFAEANVAWGHVIYLEKIWAFLCAHSRPFWVIFGGTGQVHRTTLGGPCVVEIQLCPDWFFGRSQQRQWNWSNLGQNWQLLIALVGCASNSFNLKKVFDKGNWQLLTALKWPTNATAWCHDVWKRLSPLGLCKVWSDMDETAM